MKDLLNEPKNKIAYTIKEFSGFIKGVDGDLLLKGTLDKECEINNLSWAISGDKDGNQERYLYVCFTKDISLFPGLFK